MLCFGHCQWSSYPYQLEDERRGKDSEILKLSKHISELELQLSKKDEAKVQQLVASGGAEGKVSIKLKWREGKKAPCTINNVYYGEMAAAVDGNTVYVMELNKIHAYDTSTKPGHNFQIAALNVVLWPLSMVFLPLLVEVQ